MKAVALTTLALLAAPAVAHADPVPVDQAPAQLARFVSVARAAWPASPCAGREMIAVIPDAESMTVDGLPDEAVASLDGSCTVTFSQHSLSDPDDACQTLVHEFGHLALGPDAFAATNPSDPAHSPNPASIMSANLSDVNYAPCARAIGGRELARDATLALTTRMHDETMADTCHATGRVGEASCRHGWLPYRVTATTSGWAIRPKTTKARHRTKR